jgi:hypothetical protein
VTPRYGCPVCCGVQKFTTIPVPAVPVLETPWVYPYPCSTLRLVLLVRALRLCSLVLVRARLCFDGSVCLGSLLPSLCSLPPVPSHWLVCLIVLVPATWSHSFGPRLCWFVLVPARSFPLGSVHVCAGPCCLLALVWHSFVFVCALMGLCGLTSISFVSVSNI